MFTQVFYFIANTQVTGVAQIVPRFTEWEGKNDGIIIQKPFKITSLLLLNKPELLETSTSEMKNNILLQTNS